MQLFCLRFTVIFIVWSYPFNSVLASDWNNLLKFIWPEEVDQHSDQNNKRTLTDKDGNPPFPQKQNSGSLADQSLSIVKTSTPIDRRVSPLFMSYFLADWLNSLHTVSLMDQISKYSFKNDERFINYNTFNERHICTQAYGFHSRYLDSALNEKNLRKIDFSLSTGGVGVMCGSLLTDKIELGSGLGYFYSKLHWKSCKKNVDNIHGMYLGPYIEYIFGDGSIGLMLYGITHFHHSSRETVKDKKNDFTSYNIAARLEGGYALEFPEDFFIQGGYIYPHLRLDYASIFIPQPEKKRNIKVDGNHSSFLQSQLSLLISKTLLVYKDICFLFNIDLGWRGMFPLCEPSFCTNTQGEQTKSKHVGLENKNQGVLSCELVRTQKIGLTMSIKYEAWIGGTASTQLGKVIVEWSW